MIKIGIIREGKVPSDTRVPLSPSQCKEILGKFSEVTIVVQPSPIRCFSDKEYENAGIPFQSNLEDCDVLLGVKEVPLDLLIANKTYLFFSHTMKKQVYNRKLLQTILDKKIRMIDYEAITDEKGVRLIAFGFYAGVVGAHNGVWTFGKRTGLFSLPRMHECHDYAEVLDAYKKVQLPPLRIVLTGGGRVASGAVKNLIDMGIQQVSVEEYLQNTYDFPVFTKLEAKDYAQHKDSRTFEKAHFYANGNEYESIFAKFSASTDIFMNGIYYDKKAPAFFTTSEMLKSNFNIKVIADITCDIAPDASVPCTLRPSLIADPVFGFDPKIGKECPPFYLQGVDVMAIDNLPSELPRDASVFFGDQLIKNVLPELLNGENSDAIKRGTIAENGALTEKFSYLEDFVYSISKT
jgi:saccharopine dehydrogenase (NAD+, L-lysine forming)